LIRFFEHGGKCRAGKMCLLELVSINLLNCKSCYRIG
jgi:hypothetical protein